MKKTIELLALIMGVGLGLLFYSEDVVVLPMIFFCAFVMGAGHSCYTALYSGEIWGVRIKAPSYVKWIVISGIIGLIIGGSGVLYTAIWVSRAIIKYAYVKAMIGGGIFIITLSASLAVVKIIISKNIEKATNALVLERFNIFKEVNSKIDDAIKFVVGFEGIALYSNTNFCYAVYYYEDYELGYLTKVDDVTMVAMYFMQKHGDKYTCKLEEEIIPGVPGRTVVSVGTNGLNVGRMLSVRKKYRFKSYVFILKRRGDRDRS